MAKLDTLKEAVVAGRRVEAVELTKQVLAEGVQPQDLINHYLIAALNIVGSEFEAKKIFVPEMMVAAKAMQACMEVVKPLIKKEEDIHRGTIVLGTVFGDLHDIGKNLVKLLLESSGFKVHDLGVGVPSRRFVEEARKHDADLVGLSSLLTTGDPYVLETVKSLKASDMANRVKVICGGAALTPKFVMEVCGAEAYAKDAAEGVRKIKKLLGVAN